MPKVLLVEDNEMNRDMLTRRLQRRGFDVVFAVDGAEGVGEVEDRAARHRADGHEPAGDERLGSDARNQGRSDDAAHPVIALTAHSMAGDREKAMEAGCDDYDTKPVELPRLLEKMAALGVAAP